MNLKSEKGFTGVDIAIAVIVLFIFVSIIAVLSYNYTSLSKKVEYEAQATYIAIDEIEKVKNEGFEVYANYNADSGNIIDTDLLGDNEGFHKAIKVEDYTDLPEGEGKVANLVKKVTVTISYMFKGQEQRVELSTILSKER